MAPYLQFPSMLFGIENKNGERPHGKVRSPMAKEQKETSAAPAAFQTETQLSIAAVLGLLFLPFVFPFSYSPFVPSSSHRQGPDTNHISPGRCGSGRYINTVKGGRVSVLKPYDKHSSLPCCLLPGLWHRDGSERQQSSLLSPTPINTAGQNPKPRPAGRESNNRTACLTTFLTSVS